MHRTLLAAAAALVSLAGVLTPLSASAKSPVVVAAIGDSLTDARSHGGKYLDYLKEHCPKSRFDNYGKGGNMVNQMRKRFLDEIYAPGKPAYTHVIVWGGVNDLYSDLTAGRTPAKVETDLTFMYQEARKHGAKVVALTLAPWGGFKRYFNESRSATTLELNRWIRDQRELGTVDYVADPYRLLSCQDPTKLCEQYLAPFNDGVHFNGEAHQKLGKVLHEKIFADCE